MKRNVWTKESEYYVQRFIAFPFQLPEFFASLSLSTHNNILYSLILLVPIVIVLIFTFQNCVYSFMWTLDMAMWFQQYIEGLIGQFDCQDSRSCLHL